MSRASTGPAPIAGIVASGNNELGLMIQRTSASTSFGIRPAM
jgi:hypothetical protein